MINQFFKMNASIYRQLVSMSGKDLNKKEILFYNYNSSYYDSLHQLIKNHTQKNVSHETK
jgi:hypothetical protein